MNQEAIVYILPIFFAVLVCLGVAAFAWRRRPAPGTTSLSLLMLGAALFAIPYAIQYGSDELGMVMFWFKASFPGAVVLAPLWLLFALQYTGRERWITQRNLLLLAVIPIGTVVLGWSNALHGLYGSDFRLDNSGVLPVLAWDYGFGFWLHAIFATSVLLWGVVILVRSTLRKYRTLRMQAVYILVGAFAPLAGNIIFLMGFSPIPNMDPTPFTFMITGLAWAFGLFRYRLFDVMPVSKWRVFEGIANGVILLDTQNNIVDINRSAKRVINLPGIEIIGKPVDEVFSGQVHLAEAYQSTVERQVDVPQEQEEIGPHIELHISPLHDRHGLLQGRLIVIYDISEQKRMEDELEESERQYQDLVELSPDAIAVHQESSIIYANPACLRVFGAASQEEVVGRSLFSFVHPGDRKALGANIKLAQEQDIKAPMYEHKLQRLDGQIFDAEIAWVLTTYRGKLAGQMIIRDVTERKRTEEALRAAKEQAEQLFRVTPSAIFTVDKDSIVTSFNAKASEIIGYSSEEIIGKPCTTFADEPCGEFCALFSETIEKPIMGAEGGVLTKDGKMRTVLKNVELLRDIQGNIIGGIESFEDITERKRVEGSEREQRRLAETLRDIGLILATEQDPETVLDVILEHIGRVLPYDSINVMLLEDGAIRIKRQMGYERFDTNHLVEDLEARLDDVQNFKHMAETRQPRVVSDTYQDPNWIVFEASRHVRSWAGAPIVIRGELLGFLSLDKAEPGFYHPEIAEPLAAFAIQAGLALENARLHVEQQHRATHDPLTDLPNRTLFYDRLEHALALAKRINQGVSVLFVDLDGFKTINDKFGHDKGDLMLQEIAKRLQACVRESDTVARMGGDEFTIVLEALRDRGSLTGITKRILRVVSEPFIRNGFEMHISASVGISRFPDDADTRETLVQAADTAMYRAKEQGKGRLFFFS
jgi:diguanylate cyclase (GGDEF)-like protein/PAS domain S-box-containing protein